MSAQTERNFLLEQFREFYATVLRFKREIESPKKASTASSAESDDGQEIIFDDPEAADGDGGGTKDKTPAQHAQRIQDELLAICQMQAQAVLRRGDEREQRRFREIQYVMAALADEVFLNINWDGTDYWSNHLLEQELFHTHHAGTRFFENLEELLKQRDPTRAEVAAAYLLALSVGFRGRHQEVEDQARLDNFRHQLFALLFQRNPGLAEDAQLYTQSYAHTLTGKQVQWLPVLRPWIFGLLSVFGAYMLLSHLIWLRSASEIGNIADRVSAQLSNGKIRKRADVAPSRPLPRAQTPEDGAADGDKGATAARPGRRPEGRKGGGLPGPAEDEGASALTREPAGNVAAAAAAVGGVGAAAAGARDAAGTLGSTTSELSGIGSRVREHLHKRKERGHKRER